MLSHHPDHFRRPSCHCAARAFSFTSFTSFVSLTSSKPFRIRTSKKFSCKSFRIRTYKKVGGGGHASPRELATCHSSLATGFKFFYFHTLPSSFALAKSSTLLFSYNSSLFAQNTGGWGLRVTGWSRFRHRGRRG